MRKSSARASPKAFSRRITESCPNRTIIVIIMNLWNFRFGINTSATFVEEALWKISSPICVMLREHL